MKLYDEAEKISILGVEGYRFGFFVLLGMLAAAGVIGFLCWAKRCGKGTAPLLIFLSGLLGGLFSRLGFCLMNRELGAMMPLSSWIQITGGGWSMAGLVIGVMLAALLCARITGQKAGKTLDIVACALPLFMALERFGEGCIPEFDYSRDLSTDLLKHSFLAFSDDYGAYLATWKLAGIVMLILFPILIWDVIRSREDGDTALLFLLLFGSCSAILESLRYDRFLSISFVGLEQILAAVFLGAGVVILALRAGKAKRRLGVIAVISLLMMVGIVIGLEFALDRTTFNKIVIYLAFAAVAAIPVVLALRLRSAEKDGSRQ